MFLRLSTPTTVKVGPFLDSLDGNTEEVGLSVGQSDILLSKNGSAFTQSNNVAGGTHDTNGMYGIPLNSTDLNTEGILQVYIHMAGALPVWTTFLVLPAVVYDSFVLGTDYMQTDTRQIKGTDADTQMKANVQTTIIDGVEDLQSVMQVVRARLVGDANCPNPAADPFVVNYKDPTGAITRLTLTQDVDGTDRVES